jgi:hypothetical protein
MQPSLVPDQAVKKLLAAEFPDLKRIETGSLHRGVAGARHSFLPALANSNKLDVLAQVCRRAAACWIPAVHVKARIQPCMVGLLLLTLHAIYGATCVAVLAWSDSMAQEHRKAGAFVAPSAAAGG